MNNFKSGFVAIVGRPNVGKSTLLNLLLGTKVAIVTSKAQTTRNRIQGIHTTDTEQIIFMDTPGIHNAYNELGKCLNTIAYDSIDGMDLILFIVDATKEFSSLDDEIINNLNNIKTPIILLFNKMDLINNKSKFESLKANYNKLKKAKILEISAIESSIKSTLINTIKDYLEIGPMYYPKEQLMDQSERFVVSEIIREKILLLTKQEVPHSVMVEIESFKEDPKIKNLLNINATIIVERSSQKKIIIGLNGQMIKKIGSLARSEINKFFGCKTYLELFVKVESDWRNRDYYLKQYGFKTSKK